MKNGIWEFTLRFLVLLLGKRKGLDLVQNWFRIIRTELRFGLGNLSRQIMTQTRSRVGIILLSFRIITEEVGGWELS